MIEIHIEATDGSDLRRQLLNLLGLYAVDSLTPYMPGTTSKHPDKGDFGMLDKLGGDDDVVNAPGDVVNAPGEYELAPQGKPVETGKPRRAHRRVKPVEAPVAAPVAPQEPEQDPLEQAIDQLTSEVDEESLEADEVDIIKGPINGPGAVDNEMLKREVIASLSDMFAAGQVKIVRHVLHKYGHGAKAFPRSTRPTSPRSRRRSTGTRPRDG